MTPGRTPASRRWTRTAVAASRTTTPTTTDDPEEYEPGFARADRDGRADEADVVEQDTEVPDDDDGC